MGALRKTAPVWKVDDELGVVFGWAIVCTKGGDDYFDLQGDHIPEAVMAKAVTDFMQNSRVAKEMHAGDARGEVVHSMVVTKATTGTGGIEADQTGWYVGVKPDADLLAKFKAGEVNEFSIGGTAEQQDVGKVLAKADTGGGEAVAKTDRKIITTLNLNELSLVDKGAQEPGYAPILKRAPNGGGATAVELMKRARLTSDDEGHAHLVDDANESGTTSGADLHAYAEGRSTGWHYHPYVRNDDGSLSLGMALGHTHSVGAPATKAAPPAGGNPTTTTTTKTESTTMTTDADRIKSLEAEVATLKTRAELTDAEKTHVDRLAPDARTAFLAKSATERKAEVEEATKVVYKAVDGTEYRASDDPRLVAMAKRADESATKAADVELEQRAGVVLKAYSGAIGVKKALLKAVNGIGDESTRNGALEMLSTGAAALTLTQTPIGFGGGAVPAGSPLEELHKRAEKRAAEEKTTYEQAYAAELDTTEGARLYAASRAGN